MPDRLPASALNPELRKVFRFVPNPPVRNPLLLRIAQLATSRVAMPKRLPSGVEHRYHQLGEGVGVHVFIPAGAKPRPGVLWIHGGGYVIGYAAMDHSRCARMATSLGVIVCSAEYRLAPSAPFPAALDDVHHVWRFMLDYHELLGLDLTRLAIAGQSAGGGLASSLVQRVHDEGGVQPVAQVLFCPMLDDRTAADRSLDDVRHYVWDNRSNAAGWSAYLGQPPGLGSAPEYEVPARREDLTGLPPAWIGAGDIELFYDEDRDYARRLEAAGVPVQFEVVAGAPHGFESMIPNSPLARSYLAKADDWLRLRLNG